MIPRVVTVSKRPYSEEEISVIMSELARSMSAGATAALRRCVFQLTNVDVEGKDWWENGRPIFEDFVLTPIILDAMMDKSGMMLRVENVIKSYGHRNICTSVG